MIYIQMPAGYNADKEYPKAMMRLKVIREVVKYLNIDEDVLPKKDRSADYDYARKLIYYFLFNRKILNKTQLGKLFNRHHAAVVCGMKRLNNWIETDEKIRNDISFLENKLTA